MPRGMEVRAPRRPSVQRDERVGQDYSRQVGFDALKFQLARQLPATRVLQRARSETILKASSNTRLAQVAPDLFPMNKAVNRSGMLIG